MKKSRRDFIKISGMSALGYSVLPAFLKPLAAQPNLMFPIHNIPEKKNLDPDWIRSLYDRAKPTLYTKAKNELKYIGMPAGGLHAGTVYLGGDGRLWLWGIYNDDREGVDPKTAIWNNGIEDVKVRNRDGANYVEPSIADNKRVLEQGFAIRIEAEGKTIIKELKESDWQDIHFEATYPLATIRYIDDDFPLEITVQAGGIFIPLDPDNSAIPATVYSIQLKNTSAGNVKASVVGWMENGARKITAKKNEGLRQNTVFDGTEFSGVVGSFHANDLNATQQRDAGTTSITFVGGGAKLNVDANPWPVTDQTFDSENKKMATAEATDKLIGSICAIHEIVPGKTWEPQFIIGWHFNHALAKLNKLPEIEQGYYYGKRFKDAADIGTHVALNFEELYGKTLLWKNTYYNSSLPYWFLERTFLNIGTLATANTYRFSNDRFWGWEGVNACEGTCTHVWQYAQAMGRIFPSLERDARQRTDFDIAMQDNGGIIFRAEYESRPAIDGQAGSILRSYREHQMSVDDKFLKANWPQIKRATQFMLAQDKNGDGMIDSPMENTLDAVWEGEIAWIVGLCIAAAKASQMMAEEVNDKAFAAICKTFVEKGNKNMADHLFNGEYFIHRPDAVEGRKKLGSYNTCHIDQVYGQSWAFQAGLGRLWDKEKTIKALRSLWKYNFTPDVGPYISTHTGGRPYALPGEGGMVMNTNPKNEAKPYGDSVTWQMGYFHECMSGFEHQVASHMMAEEMIDEALILTRCVHDRYHAAKRNPFNEIECSDHYARAMASYGTFISACGFEYHGPKGYISFAPKWNKENFKAAFTAAEGWGCYTQEISNKQRHIFEVKYGKVRLRSIGIQKLISFNKVIVSLNGKNVPATLMDDQVELITAVEVAAGNKLTIELG
ncbi:GH116 family glycosyl hydrolase [Niabella ginsengisoli]|uniref:Uncharacterized protein n=1 Tax=Niabella ginsengisoli TaxID=522298 RepID=A0ABS9SIS2_9BACT|nr:GH116 family glycosyl hydrolase [Niabella ginsengisoli]MCH5598263.1 hypothetical protein [Niabella ginsengisoli]